MACYLTDKWPTSPNLSNNQTPFSYFSSTEQTTLISQNDALNPGCSNPNNSSLKWKCLV